MQFHKYQHLERLGTSSVDGITLGVVHVFPKLDGTNASVWLNDDDSLGCGSRNRVLSEGDDNAGFWKYAHSEGVEERLKAFFASYPDCILYGEWLVPHSLKTYEDEAWRQFYVFDIVSWDNVLEEPKYVPYEEYTVMLNEFDIDYIPCMAIVRNGHDEKFRGLVEQNKFLIKEGEGFGEGLVLKNYDFVNKFGRVCWAKIVSNSFKTQHVKVMGPAVLGGLALEETIANDVVTEHLVQKVKAKIELDKGGWESKYIGELLGRVWHDVLTEEVPEMVKKHKNPKIDFAFLNRMVIQRVKEVASDLF